MKHLIKCILLLVLFLFFWGATLAQQSVLGEEGTATTKEPTLRSTKILQALPDGDQPVIPVGESASLPKGAAEDRNPKQVLECPRVYTPLWKRLDRLSFSDRQNASIQLEVSGDLAKTLLKQVKEIEELWNSGEFDQAIDRLRSLEESQGIGDMGVGISWKVPIPTLEPKSGTDVRIGTREHIIKPCLDFHDDTGNLFAVLKCYLYPDYCLSVNISTNGGQTWQETFCLWVNFIINDISAAVMHEYLYVGYAYPVDQTSAHTRRFFVSDGTVDATYGFRLVFDKDVEIKEIALTSKADQEDNRIYYFAILEDSSLVFCWSIDGLSWFEFSPGISNADRGLDACWNQGWTEWAIFASFVDVDNWLHVVRFTAEWEDIVLEANLRDVTSIGAYRDRILVAYEYTGYDISYVVSYDGGYNWFVGSIAYSGEEPPFFSEPHVTGRRGGGFAVVYEHEVGGEPDTCWFRHRDYGTGGSTAAWSAPEPYNEVDVLTGRPMALEWIPPIDAYCHTYGSIWVGGAEYGAYFDRMGQMLLGDVNGNGTIELGDVLYLISYLYKAGPRPDPLWRGEVTCDQVIDLGDVLYIISYLYKGGPQPNCC